MTLIPFNKHAVSFVQWHIQGGTGRCSLPLLFQQNELWSVVSV